MHTRRYFAIIALVTLAACGPGEDNNTTSNNTTSNNTTSNNTTSNNTTSNNTTSNNTTSNNTTSNNTNSMTNNTTDMCSTNDPGSDIMWVRLEDQTGTIVSWGIAFWDDIGADGNACMTLDHLDGSEPTGYDPLLECPMFGDDTVVALNGGSLVFGFLDADNVAIDLTDDLNVVIGEFGAQCPTGGAGDTYEVYLCTEPAGPDSGDTTSCTELLGSGSGEVTLGLDPATGFELWVQVVDTTL